MSNLGDPTLTTVIALPDLGEIVADVESGDLLWRDACAVLLDLIGSNEVSQVMDALPEALQLAGPTNLSLHSITNTSSRDVLWIDNARGEPSNKELIVEKVRIRCINRVLPRMAA